MKHKTPHETDGWVLTVITAPDKIKIKSFFERVRQSCALKKFLQVILVKLLTEVEP
ncbi:MAG: hypothetical protein HY785_02310 [Oscillatoriophycideae cyanobacterium NC_groundwater_1537_Pr4_S-0.65um_50_18]|nr:hypothetical protein [Oscillatoriophycideae cyanobacterium NC_groundwater_1537_Pr4_S-0.65um_50_18]